MVWAGVAVGVAGIGASMYGANKSAKAQSKAAAEANAAQERIARETNEYNYRMWLESQGIGPDGQPVNVGLPRWAYVRKETAGRKRRLVPKGTAKAYSPQTTRRLAVGKTSSTPYVEGGGGAAPGIDAYSGGSGSAYPY